MKLLQVATSSVSIWMSNGPEWYSTNFDIDSRSLQKLVRNASAHLSIPMAYATADVSQICGKVHFKAGEFISMTMTGWFVSAKVV